MAGPALPAVCWLVRQAVEFLQFPEEPALPASQTAVVGRAQEHPDACLVVLGRTQRASQQEVVLPDEECV